MSKMVHFRHKVTKGC